MQLFSSIDRFVLTNYRSYEKLIIDSSGKKTIVITGNNGTGKTNILEGVSMLSQAGPLRKAKLYQLGKIEAIPSVFVISAKITSLENKCHIGISYNYSLKNFVDEENLSVEKRQIVIDDETVSVGDLYKFIKVIWITPSMDRLFSENSSERRKFLDNLISTFYPFYANLLNQYSNLLRQRAKILKNSSYDEKWLDEIEKEIINNGVAIAAQRIEFEEKLNEFLFNFSTQSFPHIKIEINGIIENKLKTCSSVEVENFYKNLLVSNREAFKYNTAPSVEGVHRSDFIAFNLDKNILADQTSAGEQKTTVISIVFAYINMLYLYYNTYPIILIDEASAHLDEYKQNALFELLESIPTQVWITGVSQNDFKFFENKNSLFLELK